MPLYEYRCLDCGHEFEVLQKVSERPKRSCKRCKGKLEKLISRTSFQLKGGGWFAHGYSGGKGGGKSGGEGGGKSGGKSGGEGGGKSGGKSGSGSSGDSGGSSGGGSSSKAAAAS